MAEMYENGNKINAPVEESSPRTPIPDLDNLQIDDSKPAEKSKQPHLEWFVKNGSGATARSDAKHVVNGKSQLLLACEQGDVEQVRGIIESDLRIYSNGEKEECLTLAFCGGHVECVKLLVQNMNSFETDLKWKVLKKQIVNKQIPEEEKRAMEDNCDECMDIIKRAKKKRTETERKQNISTQINTEPTATSDTVKFSVEETRETLNLEALLRNIADEERSWTTPFGYVMDEPNVWAIFDNIMCPFFDLMNSRGPKVVLRRQQLDEWQPLSQNQQSTSPTDSVVISIIYTPGEGDSDHNVVAVIESTTDSIHRGIIHDCKEATNDERERDEWSILQKIDDAVKDLEFRVKAWNWIVLKETGVPNGYCAVYALITILLKYFVRIEDLEHRDLLEKYRDLTDELVTLCLFEMLHHMAQYLQKGEPFRFERVRFQFVMILEAAHESYIKQILNRMQPT